MTENPHYEALRQVQERYKKTTEKLYYNQGFLPSGIEKLFDVNETYPYLSTYDTDQIIFPTYLGAVLQKFFHGLPFTLTQITIDPEKLEIFGHSNRGDVEMSLTMNFESCLLSITDEYDNEPEITSDNEFKLMTELLDVVDQIPSDNFEINIV